jgi:signal transduction histidine kinase
VVFVALAAVTGIQWSRRRDSAAGWVALAFLTLGIVVLAGKLLPQHPHNLGEKAFLRFDLALLVVFPYLLFRFTTAFQRPVLALSRFVVVMTVALVVWSFALPSIPQSGESWPALFTAYAVLFLVHWTVLTVASSVTLWRAGRGQPSVARRRMDLLAFAATTITVALLISIGSSNTDSVISFVSQVMALAAGVAFLLGISPPPLFRIALRRPEQEQLQNAIADLMTLATTEEEIAERVLEPAAGIVGARAALIRNADGRILRTHCIPDDALDGGVRRIWDDAEVLEVGGPSGVLVLWTSPYAPFFGDEEERILKTLGALTAIALDRVQLFTREREARLALERSNEVQANFIALAAHELRTPVTTIHGFVRTLNHLGGRLDEAQRAELRQSLEQQTDRLAMLVEQLLDLSRLDADAVPIEPQRIDVRERVCEIVENAAGVGAGSLRIEVPADLETRADPAAFDRIVTNLVTNALRYGEAPVVVRAERTDRHFRLVVEDRGRGIPPEFVPDMFERFSRSDDSRERARGTGLGLAIARSYAVAHGGELLYRPAKPRGARFELVLPFQG